MQMCKLPTMHTFQTMAIFKLNINGKKHQVDVAPETPMLWVLRDYLNLPGTKYGCGIAQCGACTINLGDTAARSCVLPVSSVGNQKITTIEGLSAAGDHPLQKAWIEHDVPQCGYCQAGQMMTLAGLLNKYKKPTEEQITNAMSAVLCRCGTYHRIRKAVQMAVEESANK